jgi:hypothetical protein
MTTLAPPPSTPAAPPPALSNGGRTAIRVIVIVAAALIVVCSVIGIGGFALWLSAFRAITDSQTLPKNMRALTIDTGDIPVSVRIRTERTATDPGVHLRMLDAGGSDRNRLSVTADATGGRVVLNGGSVSSPPWLHIGELTVVLPQDTARTLSMTVQQRMGMISVDADLDQLVVKTTDSVVRLGGSARRIEVTTRHGDVFTRNPIAVTESFTATADSGDITVNFRQAPRTLEATTDNGDVAVALPGPGPYQVRAQSEGRHGDTRVTVPETTDRQAPQVTVRSESGDVTVTELR